MNGGSTGGDNIHRKGYIHRCLMGILTVFPCCYTNSVISALGFCGGRILLPASVSIGILLQALRTSTLLLGDEDITDDHGVFRQDVWG